MYINIQLPMRAFRHHAWDSGARQLTNRQPTNQKTSKATNQQTNKPTNRSKINQKSTKNPPKIDQKSTKIGLLEALGGLLEGSWVDLGLKSQNMSKNTFVVPTWPPQDGPKIHQKCDPFRIPDAYKALKTISFFSFYGIFIFIYIYI